ncbi:hypothetical protein N7493_009510 [Penicillium malachiteum]|uniref:MFS general substrate transporter n=1 Tax=Penicillium malachiteum TaxID=1324776 RepID=A0AAD6HEN3_9EURO|nr:hypothetical protein N7493_009510 [Penicillium malachiteum]
MGVKNFLKNRSGLRVDNRTTTSASTLTFRQSLWPLSLVTILFFLWGFAYGLLDTLNKHFQNTLHIDRGRSSCLQAAYFGAYPLASLGYANWILRTSDSPFILDQAQLLDANIYPPSGPFIIPISYKYIVCGPPRYSEIRINFAQAFNAIGTVVGPVLGSYAFFTETVDDVEALQRVQWVYLAIGIFVFCLAVVSTTHDDEQDKPFQKQWKLFHATLAQFTYTGAQVAIAGYFFNYAVDTWPGTDSAKGAKLLAGAQGAFAVGRFLGSGLMKYTKAPYVFLVYLSCCVAFLAAAVTQREQKGIAMLFMRLFFESVCFPTIVALGIRGLGRHYKRGSGFIVGGVCGGAVVPPILGHVADMRDDTGFAMIVPTMYMVVAWTYAVAVNFVPEYRNTVDKIGESTVGFQDGDKGEKRDAGDEEAGRT